MKILLDFGPLKLNAELNNSPVAAAFYEILPLEIGLTGWGNELYGPVNADLGSHDPVSEIPPGGLAYTNKGNYFCVFFGQRPAWSVEYIGDITEDWSALHTGLTQVTAIKG